MSKTTPVALILKAFDPSVILWKAQKPVLGGMMGPDYRSVLDRSAILIEKEKEKKKIETYHK
jgi:hypothetical protein